MTSKDKGHSGSHEIHDKKCCYPWSGVPASGDDTPWRTNRQQLPASIHFPILDYSITRKKRKGLITRRGYRVITYIYTYTLVLHVSFQGLHPYNTSNCRSSIKQSSRLGPDTTACLSAYRPPHIRASTYSLVHISLQISRCHYFDLFSEI